MKTCNRWLPWVALVGLLTAGVASADVTYIDDGFGTEAAPGNDGWTAYRCPTGQWGDIPFATARNNMGIFGPWNNDPISPGAIMGFDNGGALVPAVHGRMFSGIYKQFIDEEMPNETKHVEAWVKALSAGWDFVGNQDLKARVGIDPTGGTDPLSANIIWSNEVNSDWTKVEITLPCRAGPETVFVEATTGFVNGYAAFGVGHVRVWQTPEPATLGLLLLGLPLLRRRR